MRRLDMGILMRGLWGVEYKWAFWKERTVLGGVGGRMGSCGLGGGGGGGRRCGGDKWHGGCGGDRR